MDMRSYHAQAEACRMTGGMIQHPSMGLLEGGPFSTPFQVCLFGKTPSPTVYQHTPIQFSGEMSEGGAKVLMTIFVIFCIFAVGIFVVLPLADVVMKANASRPIASPQTEIAATASNGWAGVTTYGYVSANNLNLRACAALNGMCRVIAQLQQGTRVAILEEYPTGWTNITVSGRDGRVYAGYVRREFLRY